MATPNITPQLQLDVERFLFSEASFLDNHDYEGWLTLLAEDVTYWMPSIESVEERRTTVNKVYSEDESAYFKETRATLQMRVDRLKVGNAWAEVPQSRFVHYITNVLIKDVSEAGEVSVQSNFYVFRSRIETEEDRYYGIRHDVLRPTEDGFHLIRRQVIPAQSVLKSRSITTFF